MTEKEITLLGMNKEFINEYEGDDTYYYVLDIVDGLTFITSTNEEIKNEDWFVEIFNTEPSVRFYDFEEVQNLINKLNKHIVK
jgi:hypothetical protein